MLVPDTKYWFPAGFLPMTLATAALIGGFGFLIGLAAGLSIAVAILSWNAPEPDADAR